MDRVLQSRRDVLMMMGSAAGAATVLIALGVAMYPMINEAYAKVVAPLLGTS